MTGVSLFFTILLGLPLGILLFVTAKRQLLEQGFVYTVLSFVVNVLRSVPFLILLIVMIPVTVILIGTSLGVEGAIPPLVVGTAPFFARLVENVLREVDRGVIEACQAMGIRTSRIIFGALLPEALPGLIAAVTVTAITLDVLCCDVRRDRRRWPRRPRDPFRLSALPDRGDGDHRRPAGRARPDHPVLGRPPGAVFHPQVIPTKETSTMSFTLRKLLAAALGTLTLAAGTSAASAADRLVIAATPVPHAEILEFVKPMLAKDGVELEVKVFTDYVQPSMQTNEKRVDGNFFLHQPYLDEFKKKQKNDIQTVVAKVHVEPLGAYSGKHKAVADIPRARRWRSRTTRPTPAARCC
jgi:hypothetical protein